MRELSVIICTHNPKIEYLLRVLESLRQQTVHLDRWELLLVDNASDKPVAQAVDLSWHPHGRHIQELNLGLAAARQRGIEESSGSLLVFVDDDNVLGLDYLDEALRVERECEFLGAWGSGSISLEFEAQPADHLVPLLPWLGLRQVDKPAWSNVTSCSDATPIGAGLCIRRSIGVAYLEFFKSSAIQISGRKGGGLGAHEDYEICYLACKAGLGMGVFPRLKILHLIEKHRVSDVHILKLVESVAQSQHILLHKWEARMPRSPYSLTGAASIAMNLFKRRGFDRRVYLAELRAVVAARRSLMA
jgi:glycosyltransferase involved in cell wall biosynthesis